MLFLPMRCFMRFCYKLRSSSGVPSVLGFPELLDLVVDDSVALPLDRDLLRANQGKARANKNGWLNTKKKKGIC